MKTSVLAVVAVLTVVACGNSEPANEGKRLPAPPPAKRDLPADLRIDVIVDGVAKEPITQATLAQVAPDFTDAHQRKAWRIARLVGAPETPDTAFAITGTSANLTVEFPAMQAQNPLVPALSLSQRGQMIVEFVDPKDPFPRFHGEGGRLGRSPESEPRVSGVTRIEVKRRAP